MRINREELLKLIQCSKRAVDVPRSTMLMVFKDDLEFKEWCRSNLIGVVNTRSGFSCQKE